MKKAFLLDVDQIENLAPGWGGCYASDRITVDGAGVGYMYRETPDFPEDSGWRFLAGDESVEYMDETENFGIYDVNTIANYDRDIIEHLGTPAPATFAREAGGGRLQRVKDAK